MLGVLIALGAQEVVDSYNQRSEMRELRAAVDNEIAYGLGTYDARLDQDACLEARLAELDQWLQGWRDGRPRSIAGTISAPRSGPPRTSVWSSRDPAVIGYMPLDLKLAYGSIYDEFANNEVQRLDERMTWLALAEFDGATQLDNDSMMRLQGLLARARWRAENIASNARHIAELARKLSIKPASDPFNSADVAAFCTPILPKS